MRPADIGFALNLVLQALLPPVGKQQKTSTSGSDGGGRQHHLSVTEIGRTGSVMSHHGRRNVVGAGAREAMLNIAFLGDVILILQTTWYIFWEYGKYVNWYLHKYYIFVVSELDKLVLSQ